MHGPDRNAAELPGFIPEDFYVEGRPMHMERISSGIHEAEEQKLTDSFRRIDKEIKVSTVLMAVTATVILMEYIASGSTTADWYAPYIRKMSAFVQDNINYSLSGTLILNGIMQIVDRIRLKKVTNKLWDIIQKKQEHQEIHG